jgi:hypothetical protein
MGWVRLDGQMRLVRTIGNTREGATERYGSGAEGTGGDSRVEADQRTNIAKTLKIALATVNVVNYGI